ncbi:hypothetical protein E1293_45595 [Actinomadura darangshiensis]|uniref:Uncharacterized protein n=1 Tax=Actinomadura darangshiensis TaxID=705336 RepID=A0A4R4ZQL1_9ACTN|nr:hypothetical protein [Actinomadura darangshiensis]TDD60610.1 hypothetical protein E1293_45595 [Actinomadura darangshiensis]
MKVTLQFHGDRQEICAMVREWACELGMPLVSERFAPSYQVKLARDAPEANGTTGCGDDIDRISLNPSPVNLAATSPLDYVKKNPDSLLVHLGEQSDLILRESFLAAMTDDASLARVWKRLRERARKSMYKGAWAENIKSGARARVAGHYYTAEARRLGEAGVVPMGPTDWVKYQLE